MAGASLNKARVGRPRSEAAASHEAILDAVYELLREKPVRDLTMEAVAKRAQVGKPTLYKWWPSKAALVMAMFHERLAGKAEPLRASTAEAAIRAKVRHLIAEFNGLFGKVMADLIAEGQSDPAVLRELYEQHISLRRASTVADVERGKLAGEFEASTNPELVVDTIFAPIYYRLLLRLTPLTEGYGEELIDQVLAGIRKRVVTGNPS
jgi:AcrR family transcriptional regulator